MTTLQQLNIESFKEGNRLEAKLAKGGVPTSLWETYASFANTDGGLILLGVKENKNHTFAIEGIDNPEQMEKAFGDGVNNKKVVNINLLNNSDVEIKEVDGKKSITHYRRRFMFVHQGHVWNNLSDVFSKCFR